MCERYTRGTLVMADTTEPVVLKVHLFVVETLEVPGPTFIKFMPGFPGEQADPERYPGYELKTGQRGEYGYHAIGNPMTQKKQTKHRVEFFQFTNDCHNMMLVEDIRRKVQMATDVNVAEHTMMHWSWNRNQQNRHGFFPPGVKRDRLYVKLTKDAELAFVETKKRVTVKVIKTGMVIPDFREYNCNTLHGLPKDNLYVTFQVDLSLRVWELKILAMDRLFLKRDDKDNYGLVMTDFNLTEMGRILCNEEIPLVSYVTDGYMGPRGDGRFTFSWYDTLHLMLVHK